MDLRRKLLYFVLQNYECLKNSDDSWFWVLRRVFVVHPGSGDQKKLLSACNILLSISHIQYSVRSASALLCRLRITQYLYDHSYSSDSGIKTDFSCINSFTHESLNCSCFLPSERYFSVHGVHVMHVAFSSSTKEAGCWLNFSPIAMNYRTNVAMLECVTFRRCIIVLSACSQLSMAAAITSRTEGLHHRLSPLTFRTNGESDWSIRQSIQMLQLVEQVG